jgi:hypothetical protein
MEVFKFYALTAGIGTLVLVIEFLLFMVIVGELGGFDENRNGLSSTEDARSPKWPFIPLILILTTIAPQTVYFARLLNIDFPQQQYDVTTQIQKDSDELNLLTIQMDSIKHALENPEYLTLKQIENILNTSLTYSQKVEVILNRNDSIINLLKAEVDREKRNAEESRQLAESIRSLSRKEIEAVKLIITEDANEATRRSFISGVLFSIPIGFVMSLLASYAIRKWGPSAKKSFSRRFEH